MHISTNGSLTPENHLSNRASQDPLSAPEDRSSIEPLLHLPTLQIRHKDKWHSSQCQGVSASQGGECWLDPGKGSRLKCRPSQAWYRMGTERIHSKRLNHSACPYFNHLSNSPCSFCQNLQYAPFNAPFPTYSV